MIESRPIPAVHGVVRWRLIDLAQWPFEEFRVSVAKPTLSREVRALNQRKLGARPRHHAQAPGAVEAFEKRLRRGSGASRASDEESWVRLPDGRVMTDTFVSLFQFQ